MVIYSDLVMVSDVDAVSGSSLISVLAKAILAAAGKELATPATAAMKQKLTRHGEQKALERALAKAFAAIRDGHGYRVASYDVTGSFLAHEGAAELAKVLLPERPVSATALARLCVDSLAPGLDEDTRWDHMAQLKPVFAALVEALEREVRAEPTLAQLLARVDTAQAADAAERLASHLGAARATDDDQASYAHWIVDQHRYLRTIGLVRNTTVQLPLNEVFVGLAALPDQRPGDRAETWFKQEHERLRGLAESGELDPVSFEAAVDRLQIQLGLGGGAEPRRVRPLAATREGPGRVPARPHPGTGMPGVRAGRSVAAQADRGRLPRAAGRPRRDQLAAGPPSGGRRGVELCQRKHASGQPVCRDQPGVRLLGGASACPVQGGAAPGHER